MKTYFSLKNIFTPTNISGNVVKTKKPTPATSSAITAYDILLDDIEKTKYALEIAYSGFDNVTDPDLIDCYIYEVNSILKRYRFLMQQAQKMQLCERFDSALNVPEPPLVVSLEPSSE